MFEIKYYVIFSTDTQFLKVFFFITYTFKKFLNKNITLPDYNIIILP